MSNKILAPSKSTVDHVGGATTDTTQSVVDEKKKEMAEDDSDK